MAAGCRRQKRLWCGALLFIGWMLLVPSTSVSVGTCARETDRAPSTEHSPIASKQLSQAQLDMLLDFAHVTDALYHDAPMTFDGATGITWKRIAHADLENETKMVSRMDTRGLRWGLFEGRAANGERVKVVAFAGIDLMSITVRDPSTDIWALPAPYWEALQIAKQVIDVTTREPGVKLYLTGHSLGGGLAQFVALVTRSKAIVFNSAGLGVAPSVVRSLFSQDYRDAARVNIINVSMKGDWIHRRGVQLGRPVQVTPPPGVRCDPLTLHVQEVMVKAIRAVREESASSPANKPREGVPIDPEVVFHRLDRQKDGSRP